MFHELRILDVSCNDFMGNLPTSLFQHFRAMRKIDPSKKAPSDDEVGYYQNSIAVVTKGIELEVVRILFLYTTIDLSNNKFEGHGPSIIVDLIALRVLNLSHNGLQGDIPAQFSSLTFLAFLNLSYNHLEGCIPQGPQFHTFENNSYEGNDRLRGFPLSEGCGNDGHDSVSEETYAGSALDEESNSEFLNDFWKGALMGFQTSSVWRSGVGSSHFHYLLKENLPISLKLILKKKTINRSHPSNELSGPIPAEIGKMRSLQNLSLFSNNISGPIPKTIGDLTELKLLDLYATQLSGPIPSELGKLKNLNDLELSNNQLTGSIPSSFGN
ncbi:hypothetical protein CQW23_33266 [Capsicum baccatum]|uniref:Uncharacterized protein n=1 Tax=Capsicum baccatum TaxID=33114 RepID=A0A2G2V2F2_CAPBA|nr:hypothetical protein CQW23_33266 [Capsicum baccatum]